MLDPLPFLARTLVHLSLTLVIALGSLNGCSSRDRPDGGSGSTDAASSGPAVVTLTTSDYAFQFPDTLEPGWTTFHLVNHGGQPHMGQLIRLDPGRTTEDYLQAYGDAFRKKGPRPEWARRLGGPTVTAPHDSSNATVYLEPGQYLWTCLYNLPDGIPHVFGHGMARTRDLSGRRVGGARRRSVPRRVCAGSIPCAMPTPGASRTAAPGRTLRRVPNQDPASADYTARLPRQGEPRTLSSAGMETTPRGVEGDRVAAHSLYVSPAGT